MTRFVLLFVLIVSAFLSSGVSGVVAEGDPLERVAAYIDDQTMVIARLDIERVDVVQTIQWVKKLRVGEDVAAGLDMAAMMEGGVRQRLLEVGVREVFWFGG